MIEGVKIECEVKIKKREDYALETVETWYTRTFPLKY